MGITQFDIIRQQAEAAAKNAVSRASASLRRDTSLVNQASRLTGKAIREGEAAVKRAAGETAGGRPANPGPRRPSTGPGPGRRRTAMCAAPRCSPSTRRRTTGAGCSAGGWGPCFCWPRSARA